MLKILVTGGDGQLGWELQRSLQALGAVVAPPRAQFDLARPGTLAAALRQVDPDLVVNAAAYTAVDRAETDGMQAMTVNAEAVAALAAYCSDAHAALIHYSTDYVFDGAKPAPYVESDPTGPLSVYGRSKLAGERAITTSGAAHAVFRTSWIYGARGNNFLRTMLKLALEREQLRVVDDQTGAPTWSRALAEATAAVVARAGRSRAELAAVLRANGGVFHMSAAGATTWHRFAQAIFEELPDPARRLRELVPIAAREYPSPAARPANSLLDNGHLRGTWGVVLPEWREALRLCAQELR